MVKSANHLIRHTRRLTIRPMAASDYTAWKTAWSTMLPARNVWDCSNHPPEALTRPVFLKAVKSGLCLRAEDRFYDLGVFLSASGELIGRVSAMDVLRGLGQSAYLGYSLFNRYWGRGYGKEAVKAMIDIAFHDLNLHRLEAGVNPRNRRSILLARSLGLRKEGLKRRAVFLNKQWVDLVIYAITSEDLGIIWKGKPAILPR